MYSSPVRTCLFALGVLGAACLPAAGASSLAAPLTPQATNIHVVPYFGQVFITWTEDPAPGERYRFYRSASPITNVTAAGVEQLQTNGNALEIWERSGEFFADRVWSNAPCNAGGNNFSPRFLSRLMVPDCPSGSTCTFPVGPSTQVREASSALPEGVLAWTLHAADASASYYAVTLVDANGIENTLCTAGVNTNANGIVEDRRDPMPLDVSAFLKSGPAPQGFRVYLQYMDIRDWNTSFHAPNATNCWWGEHPDASEIRHAQQYAYTYAVRAPQGPWHGHSAPWPVVFDLHQRMANRITAAQVLNVDDPGPAITIVPIDVSDTWWFGFAESFDYRTPYTNCAALNSNCNNNRPDPLANPESVPQSGNVVNYTQYRLLRMLHDLTRDQNFVGQVDMERVYAKGHSMGGSGALSLALHFPNVFAASACSKAMTDYLGYLALPGTTCGPAASPDYRDELFARWGVKCTGTPCSDLLVRLEAPNSWAAPLAPYSSTTTIWDWLDHEQQMSSPLRKLDEMAPFGLIHGRRDTTIPVGSQAYCAYASFLEGKRAWAGLVNCTAHTSQVPASLPPSLSQVYDVPTHSSVPGTWLFADYGVRLHETVPGLSHVRLDTGAPGTPCVESGDCTVEKYYRNLNWSSSWNAWDGSPQDIQSTWVISLRSTDCNGSRGMLVDVTPRRCQGFDPADVNANYKYQTQDILTGVFTPSTPQTVSIGPDGLLTIPDVLVVPDGTRVIITR